MKVVKTIGLKEIEIIDEPIQDVINPHDVRVKLKVAGICGTDLNIFSGNHPFVKFPIIMGHELSGEVIRVGSKVRRLKIGDRVMLDPVFACGDCSTCKNGFENVCESVCCFGVHINGGYQEYITVEEKHLHAFLPHVSYEEAALGEPLSIALNIVERANLTEKDSVLIIGSGTIGLSVLLVAKNIGAKVMMADIVDEKLELAKKLNADRTVNSKKDSLESAAEEFSRSGFDVIIDAVGTATVFEQSLLYAAPRARILCISFDSNPAKIPLVLITKKELSIIGARMNCKKFPKVIKLLNEGKINVKSLISKTYLFKDAQKAFEETLQNESGNIKTLLIFDNS